MHPTYQFAHTNGFRCPLLFPYASGQSCDPEQFTRQKGCVRDINIELGGLQRVLLDRHGETYKSIYRQRTSERMNNQAKSWGIECPKVSNIHSVHNLHTLTHMVINLLTSFVLATRVLARLVGGFRDSSPR